MYVVLCLYYIIGGCNIILFGTKTLVLRLINIFLYMHD